MYGSPRISPFTHYRVWRQVFISGLLPFSRLSTVVANTREKFGQIVRRRRQQARLSQEALADAAGLHRNYVGMLERGERSPTLLVVKKLAVALGTTMVSLIQEYEANS